MKSFEDMDKEWQELLEKGKHSRDYDLFSKFYDLFSIIKECCEKRGITGVEDEPGPKEESSDG